MLPRLSNTQLAVFLVALAFGFIACVALVFVGFEYWWRGTPPYSVKQIGKAVQTHDLQLFRKHVDLRSVGNRMIDDAMSQKKQGESTALGQGLVEILRPRIVEAFESQIERFVETGKFQDDQETANLPMKDLNELRDSVGPIVYTKTDGKIAVVGLTVRPKDAKRSVVVELKMRQLSDGYWQLMEIDLSSLRRSTATR